MQATHYLILERPFCTDSQTQRTSWDDSVASTSNVLTACNFHHLISWRRMKSSNGSGSLSLRCRMDVLGPSTIDYFSKDYRRILRTLSGTLLNLYDTICFDMPPC